MPVASRGIAPRSSRRVLGVVAAVVCSLVAAGCAGDGTESDRRSLAPALRPADLAAIADLGPRVPLVSAAPGEVVVRDGDDWTLPDWVRPDADSGFASDVARPDQAIAVRTVDVSWRQIAPEPDRPLDLTSSGTAQDRDLAPLGVQLATPGPYALRLFATEDEVAPDWVLERCGVAPLGPDFAGRSHLPIWDDCVWSALRDAWSRLLVGEGVLTDPDFRFAYVPGGFTWTEFDLDVPRIAVDRGELTQRRFLRWFDTMLDDLAEIAGDRVGRLVYTGQDYPIGPFGRADDLLARRAVERGLGVRTGITELTNYHLGETPAYGSTITADGHLASEPLPDGPGSRVVGGENECYLDCGRSARDPDYAVVTSNLKALQLGMNWLGVVPEQSRFAQLPEHWDWTRLSLGRTAATSPDAWAALREAEDTFWGEQEGAGTRAEAGPFGPGRQWRGFPFVRNLERFLVQRDVAPRAVPRRSYADVHRGEVAPQNGAAYEGLRTDVARGAVAIAFDLDDGFAAAPQDVLVKVTFLDRGRGGFELVHGDERSPGVRRTGTGEWRTATVRLDALDAAGAMPGRTDLWLRLARGADDLDVRMVRVVRLEEPGGTRR